MIQTHFYELKQRNTYDLKTVLCSNKIEKKQLKYEMFVWDFVQNMSIKRDKLMQK